MNHELHMSTPSDINLDAHTADQTDESIRFDLRLCTTVVVMSAKGGCGATMVATNMAAALAANKRVCMIDLDLCKGDIAGFLDLRAGRSVNHLFDHLDALDDELIRGSVEIHPSGLHVLSLPYDLTELRNVRAIEVNRLLNQVRQTYDVVVVDVGSRVDVAALAAALIADEVVVITTPDVSALRNTQRVFDLLRRLSIPEERLRMVLNKYDPKSGVSLDTITAQLHVPLVATIAKNDEACGKADAAGRTLSDVAPRADVTRDLDGLWARLNGETIKQPSGFPWFWSRR